MIKLLIVEDEEAILTGLIDVLELEGFQIEFARDGAEALEKVDKFKPALVILDVMLPKKNGFEVCRYIRKNHPSTFVLMLTAKSAEIDKVSGLEMGADDYMTKPFSMMELLARVKSMARRIQKSEASPLSKLEFGDVCIDFKKFTATKGGIDLEFSAKEIQILEYLYQRKGEVVRREELLQMIWGYSIDNLPTTRTVDNQIAKIRAKLNDNGPRPIYITSIRGIGYKFEPLSNEKN